MDWISHFEGIAQQLPVACDTSFLCRRRSGKFYPMHLSHDADNGCVYRRQGKRQQDEEVFCFRFFMSWACPLFIRLSPSLPPSPGNFSGLYTASPWVYLIVGNICLFFGLVMLEAVPLAPPGFLNNLKITEFSGPRCLYQHDTGRGIGLGREYLHHSHSRRSSGPGGGQAPDRSREWACFSPFHSAWERW